MSELHVADRLRGVDQQLQSVKSLLIHIERHQRRASAAVDLRDAVIKSLTARLKAHDRGHTSPEEQAAQHYGGKRAVAEALADLPGLIQRAAVNPAMTTVATWAAELASVGNFTGLLPSLAPNSVYAALAARGLRLDFTGRGAIKIPSRGAAPQVAGDFILEGAPIPTRRMTLTSTPISPRKLAVLSYYSEELADQSAPSIEAVLRQGMADDTANTLDTKLLDNVAGSTTRPAGLLNGVTPIAATAGGGPAALAGDLGNLAAAIPNAVDLVYVMNAADRVRALAVAPGLIGVTILEAPGLTAKTVVALDAADFVSGENDQARFDLSSQATVHAEDTAPTAIGMPGAPAVVAAPSISMFQSDLVAIRMVAFLTWAMRRANRVAAVANVTW
jgi:hypothetical protein